MSLEYIQRLFEEKSELDRKISKLSHFMGSETCFNLPFNERSLLMKQYGIMVEYSNILKERILLIPGDVKENK